MTVRPTPTPRNAALEAGHRRAGDVGYDAITVSEYTTSSMSCTPQHLYPRLVMWLCCCACHARNLAAGAPRPQPGPTTATFTPLACSCCGVVDTPAVGLGSGPHAVARVDALKSGRAA